MAAFLLKVCVELHAAAGDYRLKPDAKTQNNQNESGNNGKHGDRAGKSASFCCMMGCFMS